MKKRVFLLGLLFLVGLSVLLYPLISSEWNRHRSDAMIDSYTQTVSQAPAEDRSAWIDSARQYNAALGGKHFPDAFANITREESAAYLAQLAFDDNGVMAYISIPRIDVSLPVYHGTSPEALAKGAGTHCVISAHRGLPSAMWSTPSGCWCGVIAWPMSRRRSSRRRSRPSAHCTPVTCCGWRWALA